MPETAMTSPRTPRQHPSELRVGLAVSELQRQAAENHGKVQRQLDGFDRKLQEHLAAPAANRERWADLQGSVSGLLEEVAGLVRRVEGLDEKLRIRTASCEELLRQRSRELEQQLHGQQQKVQLAVSTFEEMSKRQTAKLRKMATTSEEQARKMAALEDFTRKTQAMGAVSPLEAVQARLSELEGQQASLEEEFRHVTSSAVPQVSPRHASPEEFEVARALESELAKLSKQMAAQLDEHSAALANLRVKTESQEQRLSAAGDRFEKVIAPSLEAVRSEMQQLRLADRAEMDQELEHLNRQLKDIAESHEEALIEVQKQVPRSDAGLDQEMQQMRETYAIQEDQLRRLMTFLEHQGLPREEMTVDMPEVMFRLEQLEKHIYSLNQEAMTEKADRTEIHRLDLALEELQQPLRRLSQRTASNEARTTGLEHLFEQFQDKMRSGPPVAVPAVYPVPDPSPGPDLQALSSQLAEVAARVMELEEVLPRLAAPQELALPQEVDRRLVSLEAVLGQGAGIPNAKMEELEEMVSKALKTAENSGSNMQALRFDLVVEQERVAKLNKELQNLSASIREEQSKVQRTAERQEDQEARATEAMQKMSASIEKVQGLQHGYEGGTSALNKLVESIAKRMEAAEEVLKDSVPGAAEVHMLRDGIKSDLIELQDERFKDFETRFQATGPSTKEGNMEDAIKVAKESQAMCKSLREEVDQIRSKAFRETNDELGTSKDSDKELLDKMHSFGTKQQNFESQLHSNQEMLKTLQNQMDDALQRVEASEEASKAVREELMAEDQNEALTLARTCHSDLRGVHSDVADLQVSLRKMVLRIEEAPREAPKRLESRVHELQNQVASELEQLAKQQSLINKVGLKSGGKVDTQELEKSVNQLASQVSKELTELREHQGELSKVHHVIRHGKAGSSEVEVKVKELQSQVMGEVDALARQQEELGKAKVTMSELAEHVRQAMSTANECKEATAKLEERLRLSEVVPKPGDLQVQVAAVKSSAKPQVTAAVSDSDSYADEVFDEVDNMNTFEKSSK